MASVQIARHSGTLGGLVTPSTPGHIFNTSMYSRVPTFRDRKLAGVRLCVVAQQSVQTLQTTYHNALRHLMLAKPGTTKYINTASPNERESYTRANVTGARVGRRMDSTELTAIHAPVGRGGRGGGAGVPYISGDSKLEGRLLRAIVIGCPQNNNCCRYVRIKIEL